MKIGFHSGAFYNDQITEVIPRLAALGYQGVELNAQGFQMAPAHVTPQTSAAERAEIRNLAHDHGMEISSISAHHFETTCMVDPDPRERQRHVDYVKGCIDLAADVGTGVVHILAGQVPDGVSRDRAYADLLENMAVCIRYAEERDVALGLEAVVGSIVNTIPRLKTLLADLGEDKLYVNYDPTHFFVVDEDPSQGVKEVASRIVHVHVKDARKFPEGFELPPLPEGAIRLTTEFEYLPLGKGLIDFGAFLGGLHEVGYDGFLSMEYEGMFFGYIEDPWEVAIQTKSFLDDALA